MMSTKPLHPVLAAALLLLSACGSDATTDVVPDEEPALLTVPDDGFQMRSIGTVIEPGEDVEYCEVGQVPGEPGEEILFSHYELALSGSSHHLLLYAVEPGSEADGALEVGDILPCTGTHSLGDGLRSVGGSQRPYQEAQLPAGVGKRLVGGQKLVWNYHHLNTAETPVDARHAFNVHRVDSLEHVARTAAFVNRTIDVAPGDTGAFEGVCTFNDDVRVNGVSRHTHRWGTDFEVWFAGGARDGTHVWTSQDYELDTSHGFSEPTVMKAGEGFRFRCSYDNTTDASLTWGSEATDEMCILFVAFWEAEAGQTLGSQSCIMQSVDDDGVSRGVTIPAGFGGGFD